MRPHEPWQPCPCGTGSAYAACCGPVLLGTPAASAEALMRSRYTAYALGDADHLFRTWHPRTRPAEVQGAPDLSWHGLDVLDVLDVVDGGGDDDRGVVEFAARWRSVTGESGVLQERSSFERRRGRWVYVGAENGS